MILYDYHHPVLLTQVIDYLRVVKDQFYIDATVGGGGYAFEILKKGGKVIGLDIDDDAINFVKKKITAQSGYKLNKDIYLKNSNFANIKKIAEVLSFGKVAGIIFDFGLSSYQLDKSGRGFTFTKSEPLDMRMNKGTGISAGEIVNERSEEELYEIFTKYSEELYSRAIAAAIVRTRSLKKGITTTQELSEIINGVVEHGRKESVLARIYQALRIAVNNELENLKKGITDGIEILLSQGRIIALSYHSIEDRIVKNIFEKSQQQNLGFIITKKPITADIDEIRRNPRSRSVKLRIFEKK